MYNPALAHFPKMTYARWQKMRVYFSDLKNIERAELSDLVSAGIEPQIAHEFIEWREANPTEKIYDRLKQEGITTVSLGDAGYPQLLAEISDPPITLFIRGTLPDPEIPTLAVVGTRRFSEYGQLACQQLIAPLARAGVAIVSGLALGIDGIAHETALASGGPTVAVLGSGVNRANIYPAAHRALSEKIIASNGAVISEYPPGFAPTQYSFPARNRIIAGLSLGTLVIEAPMRSGSLITARVALDYNREVMAIPFPINAPSGEGNNNLLKLGARVITSADDILDALHLGQTQKMVQSPLPTPSSPQEAEILAVLSRTPRHIDEIIKTTGLPGPIVMSTLTMMEIKKQVMNTGGMKYVLGV
ncbi:MAG: DNA-processing protein DprA [Candidatus Magasanikbacteria bacterium]|jgi:DNA processing protein